MYAGHSSVPAVGNGCLLCWVLVNPEEAESASLVVQRTLNPIGVRCVYGRCARWEPATMFHLDRSCFGDVSARWLTTKRPTLHKWCENQMSLGSSKSRMHTCRCRRTNSLSKPTGVPPLGGWASRHIHSLLPNKCVCCRRTDTMWCHTRAPAMAQKVIGESQRFAWFVLSHDRLP